LSQGGPACAAAFGHNEGTGNNVWPCGKPHYLILSVAVGGTWGSQKGIDDTILPQKYYIDCERVFKKVKK